MIQSLLIANRGEIACRIIRTARERGIYTVAVYSEVDAYAPHVQMADEAVCIGPAPAAESYLVGERIIQAAKDTDADAIHPGYGFLSENADFAQSVLDAGLIWVGPNPDSIRAMGLKDSAKKLMQASGVPTTPGYLGEDQSPDTLKYEADKIGYPVLIKAVAGGGGKGMRKVERGEDFVDSLASCQREAISSFGDDRVLLEKFISNPRHIEVQVFGDTHGNVVHLFERDCTLQRRHQKVIEEAPAPGMSEAARDAICAAAVRAAKAVNYVGAGTVEFIADGSGPISAETTWFMEMNTRLQVEHPVTEMITGVDLVEWQLLIASGEPLPNSQDELAIHGWAMEARLYAENPETGFLPSIGPVDILSLPSDIRVDSGIAEGGQVSQYYDPMIAKLISWGETREEALTILGKACDSVVTWPVRNNAGFLSTLLSDFAFFDAEITTGFIDDNKTALTFRPAPTDGALAAAATSLSDTLRVDEDAVSTAQPWSSLAGFRLNSAQDNVGWFSVDGSIQQITMTQEDPSEPYNLIALDEGVLVVEQGWPYLVDWPSYAVGGAASTTDGSVTSPMPGKVIALLVQQGDPVTEGQKILTLEAMKMEHSLTAPFDGVIETLSVAVGDQVPEGASLFEVTATENAEA